MIAVSTGTGGYSLEGIMYDFDGDRAIKRHFNVYGKGDLYLGHGKTSKDGRFYIRIRQPAELDQKVTLTFRICKEMNPVHLHEELGKDASLCRNFSFLRARKEVSESVETFLLDSLEVDLSGVYMQTRYKKEQVPFCYQLAIGKSAISAKAKAIFSKARKKMKVFDWHVIEDGMKIFGSKPTKLTPENTWKLITNGICPVYLKEEGEFYIAEVDWSRYEFDKLQALADVKVWFKKSGEGDPSMDRIEVKFREKFEPSARVEDYTPVQIYRPCEDDFEEGLRIANCSFHVFGQCVFHLAIGHIYGANAAIAAFDYLAGHPLGDLLLPHCHFIRKITKELGGPVIFEDEGVLNVSALSVKGIATLISDTLAALDPFSFKPRAPINEGHTFARLQNLHFELLKEAVGEFIDENWESIKTDWSPVHGFFKRMLRNSPTYRPWGGVDPEESHWRDSSEIGGLSAGLPPRQKYRVGDDGVRSFRPVAADEFMPLPGDKDRIKEFVVDFIHHVTLWHSVIHRSQYVETDSNPSITDVGFAPLALTQYGKTEYGGISFEDAIRQLEVVGVFSGFDVKKYALVNGEGVCSGITHRIREAAPRYLALGVDPENDIQVSTVI